jgi:exodeoxyribonuclease (lambda-induced)
MKVTFHDAEQGSEGWLLARKGRCTGSKFKYARDYKQLTKAQEKEGRTRGDPTAKLILYAQDVARERLGGSAAPVFVNKAMNIGTEQEPIARSAYETMTGNLVQEAGFAATDCGMYGLSVDGLIGDDGVIEIKTMVGSDNLFTCVIDEDYSEYMDQCLGYLLFLDRQWVDLCLWAPDLEDAGLGLTIVRIERKDHEADIAALKQDLETFAAMVRKFESQLRKKAAANVDLLRMAT